MRNSGSGTFPIRFAIEAAPLIYEEVQEHGHQILLCFPEQRQPYGRESERRTRLISDEPCATHGSVVELQCTARVEVCEAEDIL